MKSEYSVEDELEGGKVGNRATGKESRAIIQVRNEGLIDKTVATWSAKVRLGIHFGEIIR